jgi:hypothetical protein
MGASQDSPMQRYYFDLRDGDGLFVDDEGIVLQDLQAVQEEAARSLADRARDTVRGSAGAEVDALTQMSIEVHDDAGPLMRVKFLFEIERRN